MVKKIKKKRAAARQRLIDSNNPFRAVTARASSQTPYTPPSKPQEKVDNNPYKSVTTYTPSQNSSASSQSVYPSSERQEKLNKKYKEEAASQNSYTPIIQSSNKLKYEVNADGSTCTITGIGTCTDKDLEIPSVIDGYKVTAIGKRAFAGCKIRSVTIPGSVTKIGRLAFFLCESLKKAVFKKKFGWCVDYWTTGGKEKISVINSENAALALCIRYCDFDLYRE